MATYYRGPTNDNYGYDRDYVTTTSLPFLSTDPWEEMEQMEWISIYDLDDNDDVVNSYFASCLEEGMIEKASECKD